MREAALAAREIARLDDETFEILARIWIESWRDVFPHIDFLARKPWLRDRLRAIQEENGGRIICGYIDDGAHGFATIEPASGRLDQLVAHPRAQGTGLARLLLNAARRRSGGRIFLDVNADNHRAVAFYKREGFRIISEGRNPASGLKTYSLAWEAVEL